MSLRPPAPREGSTNTFRAAALLLVAVAVSVLLLRHVGTTTTRAVATATTTTTPVVTATTLPPVTPTTSTLPVIPASQVKLLVLNGTLAGTVAGDTSKKLAASPGYNTLAPDNTTTKVTSSAIYAASSLYVPSATALAASLGLPASAVQTPIPASAPIRAGERTIANVVLVVGPELASRAAG